MNAADGLAERLEAVCVIHLVQGVEHRILCLQERPPQGYGLAAIESVEGGYVPAASVNDFVSLLA